MKRCMAIAVMMLVCVGMVKGALTNEGVDYGQVAAVNGHFADGAQLRSWGNWWLDWNGQYDWDYSSAYISWNLPSTKGNTYDFSGAALSFKAQNNNYANGVSVILRKSGTDVWTSSTDALGGSALHSWTVPVDLAYNGIDEIRFQFSSPAYGHGGWGTSIGIEMDNGGDGMFTSAATPTPEPITLAILGLGGLFLRRKN